MKPLISKILFNQRGFIQRLNQQLQGGGEPPPPFTADYYVDKNGLGGSPSDSNPGSITQPFLTIAKGLSVTTAGKVCAIRAGTYNESATRPNSGTSWNNAVRIIAYPGETVILTGNPFNTFGGDAPYLQYFSIEGSNGYLGDVQNMIFDGTSQPSGWSGISIGQGPHHIRIKDCEIKNWGSMGITNSADDLAIGCWVTGCHVHHCGLTASDNGIYLECPDNIVEYCHVHDIASAGIQMYSTYSNTSLNGAIVRYNKIHDLPTVDTKGQGIILARGSGMIAYNNVIYDISPSGGTAGGFEISNQADNIKVYNNTVYNCTTVAGVYIDTTVTNLFIRNNILFQNESEFDNGSPSQTTEDHNLATDPSFVNAGTRDLHIQSVSSARNAGVTLVDVPDDYDGVTRPKGAAYDIGAFEFVE